MDPNFTHIYIHTQHDSLLILLNIARLYTTQLHTISLQTFHPKYQHNLKFFFPTPPLPPPGQIRVAALIRRVLLACYQYKVKLESNFASIILAIGVLEGVGRSLDPELDILTAATPVILRSHILSQK